MKRETVGIMGSQELKAAQPFGKAIVFAVISFGAFLAACDHEVTQRLPYYHTPDFQSIWLGEDSFSTDTLHTIAPFSLLNQEGEVISNKSLSGKIYIANFFFTVCPGICPKMTVNLDKVTKAFTSRDVLIISHSVTPDIDSVAQLKKYATAQNIDSHQWHLLTGDKDIIYTLARQSYFAEQQIGFNYSIREFLHTEHFVLVDRKGHIRGIYKGTLELETERMIEDIAVLLKE